MKCLTVLFVDANNYSKQKYYSCVSNKTMQCLNWTFWKHTDLILLYNSSLVIMVEWEKELRLEGGEIFSCFLLFKNPSTCWILCWPLRAFSIRRVEVKCVHHFLTERALRPSPLLHLLWTLTKLFPIPRPLYLPCPWLETSLLLPGPRVFLQMTQSWN